MNRPSSCGQTLLIHHIVNFSPVNKNKEVVGENSNVELTRLSSLTAGCFFSGSDSVSSSMFGRSNYYIRGCKEGIALALAVTEKPIIDVILVILSSDFLDFNTLSNDAFRH